MSINSVQNTEAVVSDEAISHVTDPLADDLNTVEGLRGELAPADEVVSEEPMLMSEGQQSDLAPDEREQLLCDLEALLFVTSDPLPFQRLAVLTGHRLADVAECIAELEERYAERGLTIRTVGGGYRFATSPRARHAVELLLLPPKTSLSPAALETLAIVAYSQPVTKAEIEAVRGVSVDGVVSTLIEKGFLVEAGRKEAIGRPMLFATTQEFLESFGLPSLAHLPPLPAEQVERLAQEASTEAAPLEGTTESGIASPEIDVEIVDLDEGQFEDATRASDEAPDQNDMLQAIPPESASDPEVDILEGESLSQP